VRAPNRDRPAGWVPDQGSRTAPAGSPAARAAVRRRTTVPVSHGATRPPTTVGQHGDATATPTHRPRARPDPTAGRTARLQERRTGEKEVSNRMAMERRTAGTALVRLRQVARVAAGRPLVRSVLARYLVIAAVLLAVAFVAAPGRPTLSTPAVWDYQREAVDLQGGGPATWYARLAIEATAWAARTSIERQRDVFRYSALEARIGEPAARAVAAFRDTYRLPLEGTTVVALTALIFYGTMRRGTPRAPARGPAGRRRAPAALPAATAVITATSATAPRKAAGAKATGAKATGPKATGPKATAAKAAGPKATGAKATARKADPAGRAAGKPAGRPAVSGRAKPAGGGEGASDAKALTGANARVAPAAGRLPRNLWAIAVLLLLAGTLAVTKPQTVLATAGAPGDGIQALSAAVLGLADPTRPATAGQGTEPTQRDLASRYWVGFVGAPLSRLQTGSRVLADAPPERKGGLLGALTSQIDVVRAWAAGARGLERVIIASFSLVYVLPFALLLWALAMLAAIAQALLLLLTLAGLVAVPLTIEPRWRAAVRRWWLLPIVATAALLAVASFASLGVLRLAAVIRGADEYIGMLLAGSLLPALAVAAVIRRARRSIRTRTRAGQPGGGAGELGGAEPDLPEPPGEPGSAAADALAGRPSRRAAGRTALGGAA
jgi:hypothetical protein